MRNINKIVTRINAGIDRVIKTISERRGSGGHYLTGLAITNSFIPSKFSKVVLFRKYQTGWVAVTIPKKEYLQYQTDLKAGLIDEDKLFERDGRLVGTGVEDILRNNPHVIPRFISVIGYDVVLGK